MSKGHGSVQRAVLQVLSDAGKNLDSIEIGGRVFDKMSISESEHVSVRRALRRLAAEGLVVDMGRNWRQGRRHWATPEVYAAYVDRVRKQFGGKPVPGYKGDGK